MGSIRPLEHSLTERQKWLLLGSLMATMFIGALDQTIMATAAPKIVADLGGFDLLSWVFTSYMLSSTVAVPLVGKLSDIYGRKLFLMCGIVLFVAASAGCGIAPSMLALVVFRVIQGVGGGILFASIFATVGDMFAPADRGKYNGLFTGTFSLASVLGPTVGGLITDSIGWRWVFYINVPFGVIALTAIWFNLPLQRTLRRPKIDFLGALLLSIATVSLLLGLAWSAEQYGWTSSLTFTLFAVGLLATAAFVRQEMRHPEPILPFHLFRSREFLLGNLIVLSIGMAMMGTIPYLPTFVQTAMHGSATASGLVTTPQSFGVFVASVVGGQLISRSGRYRTMTVAGAIVVLAAIAMMLTLGPATPEWHVSAFMLLLGLGSGFVMPTMGVVIPNAVPHEFLGVANSARQFFMQFGAVVGTAAFGVILTASFQSEFRADISPETRAAVSPATLEQFADPTLALDKTAFATIQAEVQAQPRGEEMLNDLQQGQRDGITTAIHFVFIAAFSLMLLTLFLALLFKELPLRRAVSRAAVGEPDHLAIPAVDMH